MKYLISVSSVQLAATIGLYFTPKYCCTLYMEEASGEWKPYPVIMESTGNAFGHLECPSLVPVMLQLKMRERTGTSTVLSYPREISKGLLCPLPLVGLCSLDTRYLVI